ncbi:MAG: glutathione S-transferase [Candidatus Azotimanducaceae bacterium]|jgi:glutathione S-transferase
MNSHMKIYDFELSGHAHRARLMASLLNLPAEIVRIDLRAGEHKQPEYLAKNSFGQVPTLEDGELTLTDSNAILVYLAAKYDADRTWYPVDAALLAEVQVWLAKASKDLVEGPGAARLVTVFGAPHDHEEAINKAHSLLSIMEKHLSTRTYFVGDQPTVADVALYSYTAHAPEGGVDLSGYPHVTRWLAAIEALPGFVPMQATETEAKAALSIKAASNVA